jgi:hypothetical protein
MVEMMRESRERLIDGCTASTLGRAVLREADKARALQTPETARREMRIQLIEMADAFDSMGHRLGGDGATALEDDCGALRRFVRQELHLDS